MWVGFDCPLDPIGPSWGSPMMTLPRLSRYCKSQDGGSSSPQFVSHVVAAQLCSTHSDYKRFVLSLRPDSLVVVLMYVITILVKLLSHEVYVLDMKLASDSNDVKINATASVV
ncbi:hypothetical protein EJ02DRAFT_97831 [Clathrospora elynae]|uniref:Uncharacterized protein n=1 Tax=Clathrospora elynae TaxID=706981 RepID=A0A6A5S9R9_9PLEO|nr:hypothetical protein EJ02DRAFT_97831 [Clathrospora elynae]